MQNNYKYFIGIDAGTNTGFAMWDRKEQRFICVQTMTISNAILSVYKFEPEILQQTMFIVEDARKRKWFGSNTEQKQQGAGSVKRDCTIWEEFLTSIKANFQMVAPRKGLTKWDAETFSRLTGWELRTSNHGRDAAMLVYMK